MDYLLNLSAQEWSYLILFFIAVVAGIIDAIAGGGGLVTIPSLLLFGFSPMLALGTNKFQAVIGELTASIMFISSKQLVMKGLLLGICATAIGALLGAYAVSLIDKRSLEILLPIMMAAITIYSITSKKLKADSGAKPKLSTTHFMIFAGLMIGFYNGFFGPGTGSLWMVAFVVLLGYTIKQATIATKPLNLIGNLASLVLFILIGQVDYTMGLIMGVGQIIGSIIGSRCVLSFGSRLVRPTFISVCMLMTIKLVYEKTNLFI